MVENIHTDCKEFVGRAAGDGCNWQRVVFSGRIYWCRCGSLGCYFYRVGDFLACRCSHSAV
jgi:hypothetical protein